MLVSTIEFWSERNSMPPLREFTHLCYLMQMTWASVEWTFSMIKYIKAEHQSILVVDIIKTTMLRYFLWSFLLFVVIVIHLFYGLFIRILSILSEILMTYVTNRIDSKFWRFNACTVIWIEYSVVQSEILQRSHQYFISLT